MTSNVKSWPPIFYLFFLPSTGVLGRAGARKTRRVILRLSVGCVPPAWRSSGACRARGTRGSCRLCTPPRATPHLGCVSADGRRKPSEHWGTAANGRCRGCPWHVLGTRPQKRPEFPRHGHDHWVGGLLAGAPRPLAGAHLRQHKRSGIAWTIAGGQVILNLHVLWLSRVWADIHQRYLASQPLPETQVSMAKGARCG